MISFFLYCKQIWDRCVKDEITVYAAQASFFIVTAFFPFIMSAPDPDPVSSERRKI